MDREKTPKARGECVGHWSVRVVQHGLKRASSPPGQHMVWLPTSKTTGLVSGSMGSCMGKESREGDGSLNPEQDGMVENCCHAPHSPNSTQGCGIQPVSGAGPYSRGHRGSPGTGASTVPVVTTPATTGTVLPRLPAVLSPAPNSGRGCPGGVSQSSAGLRGSACGAEPLPSRAQQQETPDTALEELIHLLPLSPAKASVDPEQPRAKDGIISAGLRGSQHPAQLPAFPSALYN